MQNEWLKSILGEFQGYINEVKQNAQAQGINADFLDLQDGVLNHRAVVGEEDEIVAPCTGQRTLYPKADTEHKLIQNDFLSIHPDALREYYIPEASNNNTDNQGRADLVTMSEGGVYELKFIAEAPIGRIQVRNYITQANIHCKQVDNWVLGSRPYANIFWGKGKKNVKIGNDIIAYLLEPGLIVYFDNDGRRFREDPERILAPTRERSRDDRPQDDRVTELLKQLAREYYAPKLRQVPEPNFTIDFDKLWDILWDVGVSLAVIFAVIAAVAAALTAGSGVAVIVSILLAAGLSIANIEELLGFKVEQYI